MDTPKFTIPKPCHENWENMTPDAQGRFCGQCAKTVVDFTGMTNEEVNHYIDNREKGSICGRFKGSQLHSPPSVNKRISKMALASLVISASATLNSCFMGKAMPAEQKADNDTITETATTDKNPIYLGEPAVIPKDTVAALPVQKAQEAPKPKNGQ